MAKRFTDSEKWKDDWYISLSNDNKVVWQWLIDNCTHSGICKRSISLLNMMCKVSITESELIEVMEGRVIIHGSNWFIPKFLRFQYSTFYSAKPAIISVVKDIFEYKLQSIIPESFGNDYIIIEKSFENHCKMIKDMVKDKDKDKVKEYYVNGKNSESVKAIRFDEKFEYAYFTDGSSQRLGSEQKILAETNGITPSTIIKGSIY